MKHSPVLRLEARRIRRTDEEIAKLLADYRTSGLTQSEFVRLKGFGLSTLGNWLRRSRRQEADRAPPQLVPVKITEDSGSPSRSSQRGFKLGLPGGLCLWIPPDFDEAALRRLLPILADRC